jgi:hypothetical protein
MGKAMMVNSAPLPPAFATMAASIVVLMNGHTSA